MRQTQTQTQTQTRTRSWVVAVALGAVALVSGGCGDKGKDGGGGGRKPDAARALPMASGGLADPLRATAADVAALEAKGPAGTKGLTAIVRAGGPSTRRALRALGRDPEGGIDALLELIAASAWGDPGAGAGVDPDPEADYWPMAVEAVRTVGTLTDAHVEGETPTALDVRLAGTLALATRSGLPSLRAAASEGLGRIGLPTKILVLADGLEHSHAVVRAAAATAIGRYGKRGVAMPPTLRARLVELAADPEAEVRYGVAYALAREATPPVDRAAVGALEQLAAAPEPEIRALAVTGLASRGAFGSKVLVPALDDADWRVRVEAVRALASAKAPVALRAKLAEWLVVEWTSIADLEDRLRSSRIHPVLEGLERLAPSAREPAVKKAAQALAAATATAESAVKDRYTPELLRPIDAVACLAAVVLARGGGARGIDPLDAVASCGEPSGKGWPRHRRIELLTTLVGEGLGGKPADRAARLEALAKDPDARVRASVAGAAALVDDPRALALVLTALGDADIGVAGAAAEGIGARWPAKVIAPKLVRPTAIPGGRVPGGVTVTPPTVEPTVPADVLAALRARLADPKARAEVELLTTLIGTLAQVGGPGVNEALIELARDPRPPVHAAAAKALRTLGASVPEPPAGPAPKPAAPPGDPTKQVDQTVTWTVETTKGTFELALDPEAAPITVAALTALAEKGFYAGLLWHRVVPNFVAQGGDPTGSGWGSAGFELPSEATGARFDRGAVGIADGGRGTGSCQWFVMHTRVPHLEGRYTWIGRVAKGQDVVDALLPGDTIVKIAVTTAPRAGRVGELGSPGGQRPPDQRP